MIDTNYMIQRAHGGTSFVGPDALMFCQADGLRISMEMLSRWVSPGVSLRRILDEVHCFTGRRYWLWELAKARADMETWWEANKPPAVTESELKEIEAGVIGWLPFQPRPSLRQDY